MQVGKVEKDIPIPDPAVNRKGRWKNIIKNLNVGESVVLTLEEGERIMQVQSSFHGSVARFKELGKFTTRKISDTQLRIWRVK